MNTVVRLPVLKIWLGWLVGGLAVTVAAVVLIQPMAGLLSLFLLVGLGLIVGGPVLQIAAAKLFFDGSNEYWWLIAAIVMFVAVAAFFVLADSGLFNYT